MAYKWVDETKLNAALTASAEAIREKTGDTAQINFDMENETGFESAIEEIESGGIFVGQKWINIQRGYAQPTIVDFSSVPTQTFPETQGDPDRWMVDFGSHMFENNNTNANGGTWNSLVEVIPPSWMMFTAVSQYKNCNNLQYIHNLSNIKWLGRESFASCKKLKSAVFKNVLDFGNYNCFNNCTSLSIVVCGGSAIATLAAANVFSGTPIANGTGHIYVRDSIVNDYKTTTNWSTYAGQIKGLSDLPTYNVTASYIWDDVVLYIGKVYHCISKNSIVGISPSGDTTDTVEWEYIVDIEVDV